MMEIDWSKAPEGTTHFHPMANGYVEHWIRREGAACSFCVVGFENEGWKAQDSVIVEEYVSKYWAPRPEAQQPEEEAWTGPGLPPIDRACEAYYSFDSAPGWKPFTLKYLSDDHVIFEGLGETVVSREQFDRCVAHQFRPLRTTEQIAAEERRSAIEEMQIIREGCSTKSWSEALYDAGYRKFEIVGDDACQG